MSSTRRSMPPYLVGTLTRGVGCHLLRLRVTAEDGALQQEARAALQAIQKSHGDMEELSPMLLALWLTRLLTGDCTLIALLRHGAGEVRITDHEHAETLRITVSGGGVQKRLLD